MKRYYNGEAREIERAAAEWRKMHPSQHRPVQAVELKFKGEGKRIITVPVDIL